MEKSYKLLGSWTLTGVNNFLTHMEKSCSDRLLELRKIRGLTQEALGKMVGITGRAIANYEAGIRGPEPLICVKLALVSPTSELRSFFCQLSGDADLAVIVARIMMGNVGAWGTTPYQTGIEWTREDLERDPTWKWAWALRFKGEPLQEQEAGAKSMGISLKALQKWIDIAFLEGPEGFISAKKKRSVFASISPRTHEETRLVTRLLTILRTPGTKTKGLKGVIDDAYEGLIQDKS